MKRLVISCEILKQKVSLLALLSILLSIVSPTLSGQTNFKQQILDTVDDFIEAEAARLKQEGQGELSYKIRGLDPRLVLQACNQPPLAETMGYNWIKKRSYLKVNCPNPDWSLMIGLELSLLRDVIVTSNSIERNAPLKDDVEYALRDILAIHNGYIDSMDDISGKVTKRPLNMGQIISPHMIKAEILVPRNALVEVSAQIGTISVTSQGVALENGAFGEFIRVKNKRSNRVIEARVVQENKVEVIL